MHAYVAIYIYMQDQVQTTHLCLASSLSACVFRLSVAAARIKVVRPAGAFVRDKHSQLHSCSTVSTIIQSVCCNQLACNTQQTVKSIRVLLSKHILQSSVILAIVASLVYDGLARLSSYAQVLPLTSRVRHHLLLVREHCAADIIDCDLQPFSLFGQTRRCLDVSLFTART